MIAATPALNCNSIRFEFNGQIGLLFDQPTGQRLQSFAGRVIAQGWSDILVLCYI
jgi:hypothetical protein